MTKPTLVDGWACLSSPKKWSTSQTSSMSAEVGAHSYQQMLSQAHEGLTYTALSTEAYLQGNEPLL